MLGFDHPNVLKLLGVCFDTDDNLPLIVLPYMANGDLRSFLMSKRDPSVGVSYAVFPQVNILCMHIGMVCCHIIKITWYTVVQPNKYISLSVTYTREYRGIGFLVYIITI